MEPGKPLSLQNSSSFGSSWNFETLVRILLRAIILVLQGAILDDGTSSYLGNMTLQVHSNNLKGSVQSQFMFQLCCGYVLASKRVAVSRMQATGDLNALTWCFLTGEKKPINQPEKWCNQEQRIIKSHLHALYAPFCMWNRTHTMRVLKSSFQTSPIRIETLPCRAENKTDQRIHDQLLPTSYFLIRCVSNLQPN